MIAANDLGTFCIPVSAAHRPACQAILRGEVYEPETVKFLCDHARGDVIHGGTFFGDFLPALSRAYEHVWAFEPNPDSFKCAQITIRLNDLRNVTLRNAAIGSRNGSVMLRTHRGSEYLGGASYVVDEDGNTAVETLDSAVPADREIGMIHLDVEGYEQAALVGAGATIDRCKPIIVLETVAEEVRRLRYVEDRLVGRNYVFTPAG